MSLWTGFKNATVAVALVLAAAPAFALDFVAADDLFANRESGRAAIAQARDAYLQLRAQATTPSDKIRAVEQLGRLAFYEGELVVARNDTSARRQIFGDCWCRETSIFQRACVKPGFIDAISPANLGTKVPAYYYFRGVCSGYWGEAANLLERATFSSVLRDNINDGLAQSNDGLNYEGGGIRRVVANVWSNPEARVVGLYDVHGALEQANLALAAPAVGGADAGALFYDNARSKVAVLEQLDRDEPTGGWKDQAISYVTDTLAEMQDRVDTAQLPNGRVPEFKVYFQRLKDDYKYLTGKDWQTP